MASTQPTVLLIHGAWHLPEHYEKALTALNEAGFPTVCPKLPTCGTPLPVGLADDVAVIQQSLDTLVLEEEKEVIAIGHSYGGIVMSQSVLEKYSKASQKTQGRKGGIIKLAYMCAFLVPEGESLGSGLGGPPPDTKLPPFLKPNDQGYITMEDPGTRFYHQLLPEERDHWISKLVSHPTEAQMTPLTYGAYKYHPVSYWVCEEDQALPGFLQHKLVEDIKKVANIQVDEESWPSDHSPFLSHPDFIVKAVEKVAAQRATSS